MAKDEGMVVVEEAVHESTLKSDKAKHEFPINKVIVHPLVLLSVVDHFNRMGKIGNQKRVVGLLLGSMKGKGLLDIANSFAGKSILVSIEALRDHSFLYL